MGGGLTGVPTQMEGTRVLVCLARTLLSNKMFQGLYLLPTDTPILKPGD